LSVAINDPASTLTVRATSVFDNTVSGTATVSLSSPSPGHLGNKLVLSGQVYKFNYADYSYSDYNITTSDIISFYGGSGTITNGQLLFTIETPNDLDTMDNDIEHFLGIAYNYTAIIISDPNVRGASISDLMVLPSYVYLHRQNGTRSISGVSYTSTFDLVEYVYVESDVTVSGTGKTSNYNEDGYSITSISDSFSLALKGGWNAVHVKTSASGTFTSNNQTQRWTVSLGNPSLRWVIYDYDSP